MKKKKEEESGGIGNLTYSWGCCLESTKAGKRNGERELPAKTERGRRRRERRETETNSLSLFLSFSFSLYCFFFFLIKKKFGRWCLMNKNGTKI